MTFYLNFRAQSVGGGVIDASPRQGAVNADQPTPIQLSWLELGAIRGLVGGRDVLFGVHGFNVNMDYGTRMMARFEPRLRLTTSDVFFGVLWPGDSWLPGVDYPFEGDFAIDSGNRLATFCNIWLASARSISFLSHSLGARVVLQALASLHCKAHSVCLTAAAINQCALAEEYAAAAGKASAISVLASHKDHVLMLAYPPGDAISNALHHDHPYFEPALGYDGPPPPPPQVNPPWHIPNSENYDHGDYHPPGDPGPPPAGPAPPKWLAVADYMARAYRGLPQSWPVANGSDQALVGQSADADEDTSWLQESLNELGATPALVIDGRNGPATTKAIEWFQALANLKVDGIAGDVTRAAIKFRLDAIRGG